MLRVNRLSKRLDECLFRIPFARVLALFWLLALKQLSKRRHVLAALFWPFVSLFLPLLRLCSSRRGSPRLQVGQPSADGARQDPWPRKGYQTHFIFQLVLR